jgi:hypothetical protein
MNHEMFNKMLNAVAHALTSADVELYVAELHKLTDHGLPSDRIKAEEAIMAARRRVGTLPQASENTQNKMQVEWDKLKAVGPTGKLLEDDLMELAANDVATLIHKGKSYGDSWKRRGGVGAFMMLARKWDRIENQALAKGYDVFEACRDTDMLDDIRDLRCYLMLVEHEVTKK